MKTAAPEKKSVKTLKGQLFGAVSMMLVAAIALGTSTYAWFINNQTVKVDDMTLTVSTSTSMLVAVEKKNTTYTGYKSVITNDDITGLNSAADPADWKDFFEVDMVPASITDTSLKAAAPVFFATNNHVTNALLDEFESVPAKDVMNSVDNTKVDKYGIGQGPVKKLGLRFLASNDLDVYFGKDDIITAIGDLITPKLTKTLTEIGTTESNVNYAKDKALYDKEVAQAAAIRAALRVSVVAQTTGIAADGTTADTSTYTAVDLHTFQFDAGAPFVSTNKNNTYYNGKNTTITIAEPNGVYAAINAVDGDNHVDAVGQLSALVPGHATPASNANNTLATIKADGTVDAPTANGIKLFQLKKDIARDVDVYIWLEGTDNDCLNSISGYLFNLALPFASTPTPVTP